ncbi:MAG: GIY-YIG nuclease family protein [Candidatus Eisenbacteria bacterium]|uniref:GIY-YIG nuclease family protein n=1 Tax=Eiseniibacteriota bacterium TaxID=2212470 RepID=A0A849SLE8_UNCEI|nr:GIY-YIG nuclease family protein [Candidatus Eisenbacteria bacterium]
MSRAFSLRIFLPSGDPAGLRIVEKTNWTGHGLVVPRALFSEAKARAELDRAGVYLLVGESERGPMSRLYIGEGDPVRPRLESHARAKDFWTHAVVFTSKGDPLNKAQVQMLEARLVQLADKAKRCELENGNTPQPPSMSEAEVAEVEAFLDDVRLCLPAIGYTQIEVGAPKVAKAQRLFLKGRGIQAEGAETASGFVVFADSGATSDVAPSCPASLIELRDELLRNGALQARGEKWVLSTDYVFSSPSTAAGVLLGCSWNGLDAWMTTDGRTLKELREGSSD